MKSLTRVQTLCLIPMLSLFILSCGDDNGTVPPVDTTPPQVVSHEPEADQSAVPVGQPIRIVFSEAMDGSSAQGNITLNHGTISFFEWEDDRTLELEHSDWGQGLQITVTIGTGVADAQGNGLAAPFTFSFWTESPTLQLLSSTPPDGATDVPRNVVIELRFSNTMNLQSLETATTVREAGESTSYQFELSEGNEHGVVFLAILVTLPPETLMEVAITTDAQDSAGNTLAQATSFSFTTGGDIDTTPPEITEIEPTNGAIAAPDIGFIQITFTEPMNTESIQPSSMSAELWLQMLEANVEPSWSNDNTVLTIALPSSLPAGLPMVINLADFQDRNGVVQSEGFQWSATIAGIPDYFPVIDDAELIYWEAFEEGEIGSEEPLDTSEDFGYLKHEVQTDGTFHIAVYEDASYTVGTEWEVFRKTLESLTWVGSHDEEDSEENDIVFDPPLPFIYFPIEAGTHDVSSSVDLSGFGTLDVDWTLTLVGREDVSSYGAVEETERPNVLIWKDCWKVTTILDASLDSEPFFYRTQTLWFSPTVGLVQEMTEETDYEEEIWAEDEMYLLVDRLP